MSLPKSMVMKSGSTVALPIEEQSHVAAARRQAQAVASLQGFDEETLGKLALVVTEAATNVLIHGKNGELVISAMEQGSRRWIEVVAIDQGPGIAKLGRALSGGASTKGGLGEGLGAIRRLSDSFEIFAPPSLGTAIVCRFFAPEFRDWDADLPTFGAVCRAKRHQRECGDGWAYHSPVERENKGLLLLMDGVGHGKEANRATTAALDLLANSSAESPAELMGELHEGLRNTRGAAAAAVGLNAEDDEIVFCGIGNISACLLTPDGRYGLTSLNGALGQGSIELQEFRTRWPLRSLLILHSDGVSSRWSLNEFPGLRLRHPSLVSAVLYRDFGYDHDDATVVAVARR